MEYEHEIRKKHRPSVADQKRALKAVAHQNEPGMFDAEYHVSEDELARREKEEADSELNQLVNLVTHPEYVLPLRIRTRQSSGPYRIVTQDEKDTILMYVLILIQKF